MPQRTHAVCLSLLARWCYPQPNMSSSADAASAPHPIGPRDPETFYKAQKRNRRATWRMSTLSALAALAMVVLLTLLLTPLIYSVTLILAYIIYLCAPLPPYFWQNANGLSRRGLRVAEYVI